MSYERRSTYGQLTEQYEAGHSRPTVLIRRSSGDIQTAELTPQYDKAGRRFAAFQVDGEGALKPIANEGLTDDYQAKLAQELAESAERSPEAWERYRADNKVASDLGELAARAVVSPQEEFTPVIVEAPQEDKRHDVVKITPESIALATDELERSLGGKLAELLRGYDTPGARRAAIDPNTGDSKLREAVYEVLRYRIDEFAEQQKLPERVQRNDPDDEKSVSSQKFGYDKAKYPPRDYAALLARAMLDGSFRGDPRKPDYSDLPADDPRNGQHRQAAAMVLDSFAAEKQPVGGEAETAAHEQSDQWRQLELSAQQLLQDGYVAELRQQVSYGMIEDVPYFKRALDAAQEGVAQLSSLVARTELYGVDEQRDAEELSSKLRAVHYGLDEASSMLHRLRGMEASGGVGEYYSSQRLMDSVLEATGDALRRLDMLGFRE